jgi:hypothetical protein
VVVLVTTLSGETGSCSEGSGEATAGSGGGGSGSLMWRFARAAELAHRASYHAAELGKLRGAEDQERQDADDEHLLEADVEHGARVTRRPEARPRGES